MARVMTGIVVLTVLAGPARLAAQEGSGSTSPAVALEPPLIVSARMSADRSLLVVSGVNLGSLAPTLSLGLSALPVLAIEPSGVFGDPDVVTATLPGEVSPGTYLLALTRSGDEEVAIFYLAVPPIGAVYQ